MVRFDLYLINFKSEDDYFKLIVINDYFYWFVCKDWLNQNPRGERNESGLTGMTVLYDLFLFYVRYYSFVLLVFPSCHLALYTSNWPIKM